MNPLDIILSSGDITSEQANQVAHRVENEGVSLEQALLDSGVAEDVVRDAFASFFQVPSFTVAEGFTIPEEVLSYIQEESAVHYRIIPLKIEDGVLLVGVNDPENLQVREVLNFVSTKHDLAYKIVFMLDREITKAQEFYSNLKGEVTDALVTLKSELDAEIAAGGEEPEEQQKKEIEHIEEDAPVTKIVATTLRYACLLYTSPSPRDS